MKFHAGIKNVPVTRAFHFGVNLISAGNLRFSCTHLYHLSLLRAHTNTQKEKTGFETTLFDGKHILRMKKRQISRVHTGMTNNIVVTRIF